MFDLAESPVNIGAKHFAIPFAPRQPVAMLAAEGPTVFENQVGDVARYTPHPAYVFGILQIQERPDMQAADAGMPVKRPLRAMPLKDLAKTLDKFRQPGRWHRCVLDKCD